MTRVDLHSPSSLPVPNGYSHVAGVPPGSRLVWTSGQVPVAADGTPAPAGDWESQTRLVMQNVGAALEAGGAGWDDVFKLTIFVVDTSALPTIRAVRDEFVDARCPPTSSLVQVAGLVRPDILIEVEAVAAVPMATGSAADLDNLADLNRDYIHSVQHSDVRRFDEILAEDFLCSNPDGSLVDRAAFLAQTAKPVAITDLRAHEVDIRLMGDVAIIHARTTYQDPDGQEAGGRYTDVWARRQGRWLAVSAHVTRA